MGFVQLLAVDTANVFARNLFKLKELSTSDGKPSGGLYGSIRTIEAAIKRFEPDTTVLCLERGGRDYRRRIEPTYKGDREDGKFDAYGGDAQWGALISWANHRGLDLASHEEREADDVIAQLVREDEEGTHVILSGDHDFKRLLVPDRVWLCRNDIKGPLYSARDLMDELGVTPEQYGKLAWITGDGSDNVPGIKGFGPKKALKAWEAVDWDKNELLKDDRFNPVTAPDAYNTIITNSVLLDFLGCPDIDYVYGKHDPAILQVIYNEWEFKGMLAALRERDAS